MTIDPFVVDLIKELEERYEQVCEDPSYEVFELIENLKKDKNK
jgi:hypothetical protein